MAKPRSPLSTKEEEVFLKIVSILESSEVPSEKELASRNLERTKTIAKKISEGKGAIRGEAAGFPEIYSLSEQDFFSYLHNIKDDITENGKIALDFLDLYLRYGETVPPHFVERIVIILSKRKLVEEERKLLRVWVKHFGSERYLRSGSVFQKLLDRAVKKKAIETN